MYVKYCRKCGWKSLYSVKKLEHPELFNSFYMYEGVSVNNCGNCGEYTSDYVEGTEEEIIKFFGMEIKLCKCGQPASPFLHVCPFKAEINGDKETLCNCCEKCRQLCKEEI